MSDYVKSTNFTSKDSLASGNPLKIVKGTEIDIEFNAIATAMATKADLASPSFTGAPLAPAATLAASLTQIATVATVQALYPVGSIYINAGVSTNPATLLGFGTWVAFGTGRVLVGVDAADAPFDTLGETGGSKDSVVVSHTHTATVTDPGHSHSTLDKISDANRGTNPSTYSLDSDGQTGTATTGISVAISTTGSSGTNANLQPYITVAMWKRTA